MLRQRIITAVIMLAVLVAALWSASPVPFIVLALVMMAAAAWEWARLNGVQGAGALALGAAMVLACGLSWWAGWVNEPFRAWWLVVALWVVVGGLLISVGVDGWSRVPAFLRLALGPAALWVAWLAVVQARLVGVNFLLSVLALVAGVMALPGRGRSAVAVPAAAAQRGQQGQQHDGLHQREITVLDRLHRQAANPRPGKNDFRDQRAAEQG